MPARTEVAVKNFIIFNSTLGEKEGEEEQKLLYYHPKNVELDIKIKDIGLCEAIIKFTSAFTSKTDVQNVATQKTLQIYYLPEPDYWMVLTLSVPSERKFKSGQEQIDYYSDQLHESTLKALLEQTYASFKLLHGSFLHNFKGTSLIEQRKYLMNVLEEYFLNYFENFFPQNGEILNTFQAVSYLPINQSQFLKVQAFINILEATFSENIFNCVFLFNKKIVWSGLAAEFLYPFNEFLKKNIFPKLAACELQSDMVFSGVQGSHYGTYIVGPPGSLINKHAMWIRDEKFTLLIYKAANCTVCLFVKEPLPENFYEESSILMGTQMIGISTELQHFQEAIAKEKELFEPSNRYTFVNELTQKFEGAIHLGGDSGVSNEVMNILADIYQDRVHASSEEVIVKTHNDWWLVRKSSNHRHYFLIINKSSSTLIDITEEAKRIIDTHIRSIFFEK